MLGWLVHERGIEPHIPVFDKSRRIDGTYDHREDAYPTLDLSNTAMCSAMCAHKFGKFSHYLR
jgi:hypothetical protein